MIPLSDWLPLSCIGLTFSAMGIAKVYGRRCGIIGGGGKPWSTRMCGSCPTFSRPLNIAIVVLFLAIGLAALTMLALELWHTPG